MYRLLQVFKLVVEELLVSLWSPYCSGLLAPAWLCEWLWVWDSEVINSPVQALHRLLTESIQEELLKQRGKEPHMAKKSTLANHVGESNEEYDFPLTWFPETKIIQTGIFKFMLTSLIILCPVWIIISSKWLWMGHCEIWWTHQSPLSP